MRTLDPHYWPRFSTFSPEAEKYFRTIIQVFCAPEPATAARRQSLNDSAFPRFRTPEQNNISVCASRSFLISRAGTKAGTREFTNYLSLIAELIRHGTARGYSAEHRPLSADILLFFFYLVAENGMPAPISIILC